MGRRRTNHLLCDLRVFAGEVHQTTLEQQPDGEGLVSATLAQGLGHRSRRRGAPQCLGEDQGAELARGHHAGHDETQGEVSQTAHAEQAHGALHVAHLTAQAEGRAVHHGEHTDGEGWIALGELRQLGQGAVGGEGGLYDARGGARADGSFSTLRPG